MKKKNMGILFFSLVIVMTGYGIAMPVLPFYIETMGGSGIHYGLLITSYGLMQLLFAPVWGGLSDKHGRKPILLIGLFGLAVAMVFLALADRLWMLYVAQLMSGGLSCAAIPAAQAYIGDSTDEENRAGAMGRIGGAIGLGMIIGPGLGGLLAVRSLSDPFYIAAGFCAVTVLMIFFWLPESLAKQDRQQKAAFEILPVKSLWEAFFSPMRFGLLLLFTGIFGQTILSSIFGMYAMERFVYGPEQVGLILMSMALMYALAQGLLVGPVTKKIGEIQTMQIALLGGASGFFLILLAGSFVTVLLSMGYFILFVALLKPSALSWITRQTTFSKGRAMGIAESYMSFGRIIGPLWAGALLDVNVLFPFGSGALIFIGAFATVVIISKKNAEKKQKDARVC